MDHKYYGLIEMLYVFGIVLAFAGWEMYTLKRDKKRGQSKKNDPPPGS